jgi:hypothetical protein
MLDMGWDGAYPPRAFYKLFGRIGHKIAGVSERLLQTRAIHCQQAALRSEDASTEIKLGNIILGCYAFSDKRGGTLIGIYRANR